MSTDTKETKTRTILDRGGYNREMELVYESRGTQIYIEEGTGVVCAFLEYDSLDASALWSEDISQLVDEHPLLRAEVEHAGLIR